MLQAADAAGRGAPGSGHGRLRKGHREIAGITMDKTGPAL